MKRNFLFYELWLYFIFAIVSYILKLTNNANFYSFISGIFLLPIVNLTYDLLRKVVVCIRGKNS